MKFEGYDWTELLQLKQIASNWPVVPKGFKKNNEWEDLQDLKKTYVIREYLSGLCGCAGDRKEEERRIACGYVRQWLLALSRHDGYERPVFQGIAAIEHDEGLLRWVIPNLEMMWT